jgi:RNA polymerase sigma-70 factor, ECF subfamily
VGDDRSLVQAAQGGDRAALDALLRRHHDRIHALCRRICLNDADALDATQEALIAIVRGLHRFDGRAAFSTWSYRVATNACLDELRRRKRRPRPGLEPDQVAPRGGDTTERSDVADAVAARVDVDHVLAQLAPDHRAVVVLRDLCGLDYAEIAETLDVPVGTVRSRLSRARGQLADLVAGNPATPPRRPTTRT